jgi:7-carboxy-7-deazaguanine synthase
MKVPLAEHFHSLQGEGHWVGTPMHFIRLPGCSVGKQVRRATIDNPGKLHEDVVVGAIPLLSTSAPAWLCHTFDDHSFWCDTDFNKRGEEELGALLSQTWEEHICLTGGEPLIHYEVINELIYRCYQVGKQLHIETSGTIVPWWEQGVTPLPWLTVSPKLAYYESALWSADEVKVLVHRRLDSSQLDYIESKTRPETPLFLSPINFVLGQWVNSDTLQKAQELLKVHPRWRLSVQLHKYLGLR